ncbi:hypothetical protein QQS21_000381 [Conoideocrella luteorostrata]|uniref:DUF1772-domain-containing protein n=1 Tax=Conoideocrella luteorostrata TaxID=1105319 RepID=A0AAJ0D1V9_9HYPO|nr:hypothetical protein QQS21_000381 [Conoideocrella luteorostrata]
MASYSISSTAAIATGLLGSAWMSGAIASISLVGIPVALKTPGSPALIWRGLYSHGVALMPKIAVATALSYSYASYSSRGQSVSRPYLVAAGLVVSIIPFTLLFMSSTNAALMEAASGASSLDGAQISDLIKKWGLLNMVRSLFPLAGGVVAFTGLWSNV